ncbi:hypothetical protein DENSPDRAFT_845949 [Dentipellis sp. KUC8613]|nr:hypothetical protein DENSPDRAFT_845949 [Dentipellis sp. KUC8613]
MPSYLSPGVSRPPCTVAAPTSSRRCRPAHRDTVTTPSSQPSRRPRPTSRCRHAPPSRDLAPLPYTPTPQPRTPAPPSRRHGPVAFSRALARRPHAAKCCRRATLSNPPHCHRASLASLAATRLPPGAVALSSRAAMPLSRATATLFGGPWPCATVSTVSAARLSDADLRPCGTCLPLRLPRACPRSCPSAPRCAYAWHLRAAV